MRAVLVGALALAALGSAATGSARAQNDTYWCSAHPGLDPCVVSASVDGSPIAADDPTYDVSAVPISASGAKSVQWSVQGAGGPLPLGHTYSLSIDTTVVPRVIDGAGAAMQDTRTELAGNRYEVTITGQPVEVTDQEGCVFPAGGPSCSEVAPGPSTPTFSGEIDDFNSTVYTSDPLLPSNAVDSFYGMDMYTNITETGLPPTVINKPSGLELQIQLADHHFQEDGTTLVQGNFFVHIPAAFLNAIFGINDPSSIQTDSLDASIGAGTLTVVDHANGDVDVTVTGATFSPRTLDIQAGVITPARPGKLKVRRLAKTARIAFAAAQPRGQIVTGYSGNCYARNGDIRLAFNGHRSPLTVRHLRPGLRYRCYVAGHSKAGPGDARSFTIPR